LHVIVNSSLTYGTRNTVISCLFVDP